MKSSESRDQSLTAYIEQTKHFSLLPFAREQALATAWRDHHDEGALSELVSSHLRLVIKVARGFAGYGLPFEDLISEGNVGLMQAAQKFDPSRGFRFSTYALWWIRAAIQQYVLQSWSLVKIGTTSAQKRLFFNLGRLKARLQQLEFGDLSPDTVAAIAAELGVGGSDVIEMNRRMAGRETSLNTPTEEGGEYGDFLVDERPSPESLLADADETTQRRRNLHRALDQLDSREREIVIRRHIDDEPQTLEELSQTFNVSRERIRQLETRALDRLNKSMHGAATTPGSPAQPASAP